MWGKSKKERQKLLGLPRCAINGASIKYVHKRERGKSGAGRFGLVNLPRRGRGGQKSENSADVLNGSPLMGH